METIYRSRNTNAPRAFLESQKVFLTSYLSTARVHTDGNFPEVQLKELKRLHISFEPQNMSKQIHFLEIYSRQIIMNVGKGGSASVFTAVILATSKKPDQPKCVTVKN